MSSELDFNTFQDKIASDLSKFHFRSILNHSLLDLTKSWNITPIDILEKKGKLPWNILRLIMWSSRYSPEYTFGRPATYEEYENLYIQISNAPISDVFDGTFNDDPWPYLRCLVFNQLPHQIRIGVYGSLVEQIIFSNYLPQYDFSNLEKGFGLKVDEILELKYIALLFLSYSPKKEFVSIKNFEQIFGRFQEEIVFAFLNQLCVSYEELKNFCLEFFNRVNDPHAVYYSRFPFYDKPIIKIKEKYCVLDQSSSIEAFNYYLYNRLRKDDPENFPRAFGDAFEKYVHLSLSNLGHQFLTEAEISKQIKGKPCDFILEIGECVIFIECKSMEWHHGIFTNPLRDNLIRAFKSSVIKGYNQIGNTFSNFQSKHSDKYFIGMILTYKFLPYGNSVDIWKEIGSECPGCNSIWENIFILSCFEFENLLFRQREEGFDLKAYFHDIIEKNRGPVGNRCSPMEFLERKDFELENVAEHLVAQSASHRDKVVRSFPKTERDNAAAEE